MMEDLEKRLASINDLAEKLYAYVEQGNVRLTRRRLVIMQSLLFTDHNTNAIFTLLNNNPPYLDGVEMIMRSLYDLSTNVDYMLNDRSNKRIWRWYRDDRWLLLRHTKESIALKEANPKLFAKTGQPLDDWKQARATIQENLRTLGKRAGLSSKDNKKLGEVGIYEKVKSSSPRAKMLYRTLFWMLSTKVHASPTGLQDLVSFEPFHLRRRSEPLQNGDRDAHAFGQTTLTWYAAQLYNATKYLKTPFVSTAKPLYEELLKRPPKG